MTEQHPARDLLATLQDALDKLEVTLGLAREDVAEVASQADRLREGVAALRAQREDPFVETDLLIDAAADFLAAFRDLDSGILAAQAEVDTRTAEMADDEESRDA